MGKHEGKFAIVTGANRDTESGGEISYTPCEGDHPSLEFTLNRAVELICAKGDEAEAVAANVSRDDGCIAPAQAARGPIDNLANCAALNYYQPVAEPQTTRSVRSFTVDVYGPASLLAETVAVIFGTMIPASNVVPS